MIFFASLGVCNCPGAVTVVSIPNKKVKQFEKTLKEKPRTFHLILLESVAFKVVLLVNSCLVKFWFFCLIT